MIHLSVEAIDYAGISLTRVLFLQDGSNLKLQVNSRMLFLPGFLLLHQLPPEFHVHGSNRGNEASFYLLNNQYNG